MRSCLLLLFCMAAAGAAAEETWPEGWAFRVRVAPADQAPAGKAASCDLWLQHNGLAQPDARDVRVFAANGQPVSHFVSFADDTRARVVFDGTPAPPFSVYFGNFDPKLPAVPANGLMPLGRADWLPEGGYSCTTMKASTDVRELAPKMMQAKQVADVFTQARTDADAGQKQQNQEIEQEKQQPPDPKKPAPLRVPFLIRSIFPHCNPQLPADPGENVTGKDGKQVRAGNRFLHLLRAEIDVEQADKFYFLVAEGDTHTATLKTLVVDGNIADPAVKGWYGPSYGYSVFTGSGQASLAAGRRVIELYTISQAPNIRIRIGDPEAPQELLDGRFAHFENAAKVSAGDLEVQKGTVADAWLATVDTWTQRGRSTVARTLCRVARERFAGQPELLAKFAAAAENALQAANRRNWPTEGKYPSRIGFVPDVAFGPPFRQALGGDSRSFHDPVGMSSAAWGENGLIVGLPFKVFQPAWSVTSGTCLQDGVLYAGMKTGQMVAVDSVNGTLRWSFPGEGPCYGTPLLYRDVLYYGALDRRLYALDARRGRMLWNFPAHGWIEGSPAADNGIVFFGTRNGDFHALDASLGVERWAAKLDGRVLGTPACSNGRVFIGTQAGTMHALDAASGKPVWTYKAAGAIEGGCCVGYGRVFFGDLAGQVHAVDVNSGKLAWAQPVKVSGPVAAAPILVGRVLYGGTTDGSSYWAIDADEASIGWWQPVANDGDVHRPPVFALGDPAKGGDAAAGELVFTARGRAVLAGFVMAGPPPQDCLRAIGPIQIDGALSEDSWKKCPRLPVFRKHNGMEIGDPVEARMMWDDANLYFGITVKDTDLAATAAGRDADLRGDDSVTIVLDPQRGGLAVAQFAVSARGVQSDALLAGLGRDPADTKFQEELAGLKLAQTGPAWNPDWKAAVQLQGTLRAPNENADTQDTGWTAEIAIPLASLPPTLFNQKPAGQTWAANVIVHSLGNGPAPAPPKRTWCLSTTLDPDGIGALPRWMPLRFEQKTVEQFAKEPQKK